MHTFLDNFHQGGKYSAQIASHQAELRREGKFTDQKLLEILSLQTEYLNLDIRSGFGRNTERAHAVQTKCTFFGGNNHSAEKFFKRIRKEKKKARAVDVSSNRQMKRTPRKCFRWGSEDHMIEKCSKPPKDNDKRRKQLCSNEKVNLACDNGKNNDDQKIYSSMAKMSSNDERSSENYGDSLQLTIWVLDLVATCHMTPEVSDFIPGSLEDTDKYIEVADKHHVTEKQKGQVRIQTCDDNVKPFIPTLHNVFLELDLCDRLSSIITLMNSRHTYLFYKGFCTV